MNAISELQKGHRSIRRYKPDLVEPVLVEGILGDAIAGSASSGNLNCVSIVVTRYAASPELRARIDGSCAASLAQYCTSKAKYDPDVFRKDSAKLAALLAAKHFLP
jgi:nitroreductase